MDEKILLITMICCVAGIFSFYFYFNMRNNPEKSYLRRLKDIIKNYQEILIKIDKMPDLDGRIIVRVNKFDDLLKIQRVIRKPVYYYQNINFTDFILISSDEICVLSLKSNGKVITPVDNYVNTNIKKDNNDKKDKNLLDDIDKTSIIEIDNGSIYKVSPLKTKKKNKIDDSKNS